MSKCIEFNECRYGCSTIPIEFVQALKFYVDFILVCADAAVEICLDIPRDTIRLVSVACQVRLMQQATNLDLAYRKCNFCWRFLAGLHEVMR